VTRSDSLNDREFFDYVCSRTGWAEGASRGTVGTAGDSPVGLTDLGCAPVPVPGGNLK
jgi:hypothetical protein